MHKNPTKARFIIGATKCLVKRKAITAALNINWYITKSNTITWKLSTQYYHSVKIFWPVQNNQTVIDAISEINSRNKTFSISTLDLSTLYTNTPHHNLKSVMGEFDFHFNGGDKEFIGITKYSATWTNNQQIFNKLSLKFEVNYSLNSHYFTLGDMCFDQLNGIPMWVWPSLFCGKFIFILL